MRSATDNRKTGFALTRDAAAGDFPYLHDITYEHKEHLQIAVKTKLFKAPAGGRITPLHRHIAEYLAASYISNRINHDGLPIGRVLALITGQDGVVVAEMRGLSAWLAAICLSHRDEIIDRDPLGVVLYGDVQVFSHQHKRRILEGLRNEADRYAWFRSSDWTASPFGALATPDMVQEFHEILTSTDRTISQQALVDCVLDALEYGHRFLSINDDLLAIVRDRTWLSGVRRGALSILLIDSRPNTITELRSLLDDICDGNIEDLEDDLLGYLLQGLYPHAVEPTEILDFIRPPKRRNYFGQYHKFWDRQILKQSSDPDVQILLDALILRLDNLRSVLGGCPRTRYFRNHDF